MNNIVNEVNKLKIGDNFLFNLFIHNKTGQEQKILLWDFLDLPYKNMVYVGTSYYYLLSENPSYPIELFETCENMMWYSGTQGKYVVQKVQNTTHGYCSGTAANQNHFNIWSEEDNGQKQYLTIKDKCIIQYSHTLNPLSSSCKYIEL